MKQTAKLRNTRIALISCSKKKSLASGEIDAWKRYLPSTLFALSYDYATRIWKADQIFILSAKYGIISANAIIPYYEMSLNSLSRSERYNWARPVRSNIHDMSRFGGLSFLVLAGETYTKDLDLEGVAYNRNKVVNPLTGLGMGKRMQRLRQMIGDADEAQSDG